MPFASALLFFDPMKYLETFTTPHLDVIQDLIKENNRRLAQPKKGFLRYQNPLQSVSHLRASSVHCNSDRVSIGKHSDISDKDYHKLYSTLRAFMPWRKGPFSVFGIDIDAEWRSERKWNRLLSELPDLSGKKIADIGCNNGYYMFRMQPHNPELVMGFEPYIQHYYAFKMLNTFAGLQNLHAELLGVEHIALFENCFDVIFLMGILYHRISPLEVLKDVRKALAPGGTLLVESQAIPGDLPVALFPEGRYAKVPGTYFVPTGTCLINWMRRAGFNDVKLFCSHPMSNKEQQKTAWMEFESYDDFIDPHNPDMTVEGYPAPLRIFLSGKV